MAETTIELTVVPVSAAVTEARRAGTATAGDQLHALDEQDWKRLRSARGRARVCVALSSTERCLPRGSLRGAAPRARKGTRAKPARRPGYPRPSAPRIVVRGLCRPGDPPPWPPPFPLLPPVSPTGRGAAQRCADTPKGRRRLMPAPKFIDIDGKRFLWRELLQRRREQVAAAARVEQPALFELKEDCRPVRAHRRRTLQRAQPVQPARAGRPDPGFQPLRVEYVTKSRSSPRNQPCHFIP